MGVLIDASVLIAHERAGVDLEPRIASRADDPFFLSAVIDRFPLLATANVRELGRVPGLDVEDWS